MNIADNAVKHIFDATGETVEKDKLEVWYHRNTRHWKEARPVQLKGICLVDGKVVEAEVYNQQLALNLALNTVSEALIAQRTAEEDGSYW